jgi:hypothetical protein
MWMRDIITPVTKKNSSIHNQFINKAWTHGVPLTLDTGEQIGKDVDFLQKYMGPLDIGGAITILQYLSQEDDSSTGVSAGMSGRESPMDPTAPASKTLALLKMSGIDIEAYINSIAPSFNLVGEVTLQLYYQIAQDGIEYRLSPDRAKPDNPFAMLTRAEMIAKTNIQVMARSFNFDKISENQKDLMAWQLFRPDPAFNRNPEAVYTLMKHVLKGISPKWSNLIDSLLPPPSQFEKEQLMTAIKAVGAYTNEVVNTAQVTGQQPILDPNQLKMVIMQYTKEMMTPATPEEMKAREQGQA